MTGTGFGVTVKLKANQIMKKIQTKPALELLSILAHDMALWWLNSANEDCHNISPAVSLSCARSTGLFIGQLGEAAWNGNINRVLECLVWIEADNHIPPSAIEARAITEYVAILRELALADLMGRPPMIGSVPSWVKALFNDGTTLMLLGHGEPPKVIFANAS